MFCSLFALLALGACKPVLPGNLPDDVIVDPSRDYGITIVYVGCPKDGGIE